MEGLDFLFRLWDKPITYPVKIFPFEGLEEPRLPVVNFTGGPALERWEVASER